MNKKEQTQAIQSDHSNLIKSFGTRKDWFKTPPPDDEYRVIWAYLMAKQFNCGGGQTLVVLHIILYHL